MGPHLFNILIIEDKHYMAVGKKCATKAIYNSLYFSYLVILFELSGCSKRVIYLE